MCLKLLLSLQLLLALSKNLQTEDLIEVPINNCGTQLTAEELQERLDTRRANTRVCVADCLGLKNSSEVTVKKAECLYNSFTGNAEPAKKKIKPFKPTNSSDFKVFCFYRADQVGPTLSSLAASKLCTNIMVEAFVEVSRKPDEDTYTIALSANVLNGIVEELKTTAINFKDVKLHLAFGEWSEDSCRLYSEMASTKERRKSFIENIIDFLVLYKFNGLHLDWKYPVCWLGNCKAGPKSDKINYVLLISELATSFKPMEFMLSCSSPVVADIIKEGFDAEIITDNVDFIIFITRGYHGLWDRTVEHQAVVRDYKQTIGMVKNYVKPNNMKKIVAELSSYWDVHTLADNTKTRTGSKSLGPSSRFDGHTSYYILCSVIKEDNWTVARLATENLGFYAYKDDQWVAYDDAASLRFKAKYFRKENMTGVSLYTVNGDDFNGSCGCGNFPLLTAISEELRGQRQELPDCT